MSEGIYCGFMWCEHAEPGNDNGAPPLADTGDHPMAGAGAEGHAVSVSAAVGRVVVVAVRGALSRERVVMLRHAALAQLARHPQLVIVEFSRPALLADHDPAPLDAAIAVLIEVAREAADADVGL